MPFPTAEDVRKAVEDAVRNHLENESGDWLAELSNGREIDFCPSSDGCVEVLVCLPDAELDATPEGQPVEQIYRLRVQVVVEAVSAVTDVGVVPVNQR